MIETLLQMCFMFWCFVGMLKLADWLVNRKSTEENNE